MYTDRPVNTTKPIGLCSDHAGYELKKYVISILEGRNMAYIDFGTYTTESCDYPDFAHQLGNAIDNGECEIGIAVCSTGNGINMAMNKHQSVRSALCWNEYIAKMARAHNDANVLTIPGSIINREETCNIINLFLITPFDGGRHERRVAKIPL